MPCTLVHTIHRRFITPCSEIFKGTQYTYIVMKMNQSLNAQGPKEMYFDVTFNEGRAQTIERKNETSP